MFGFDNLHHASLTDVGVRRSHNQDAFAVLPAPDRATWEKVGHVYLVADGMGGHAVGEKASAQAVREIPLIYQKYAVAEGPVAALRKAFVEANAAIYAVGQANREFEGMGTTATAVVFRPEGAWIGHVGDSRVYRVRDGKIDQLSFDHSAVWEIARRRGIEPEELEGVKKNAILRSLGPEPLVQPDVEGPHPLRPGDVFVLCSDGLSGPVTDAEIGAVVSALPPEEACRFLIDLANLHGGPDNITALVIKVEEGEPTAMDASTGGPVALLKSMPWPLTTLAGGLGLALLAIGLIVTGTPGGAAAFVLAALTIGVGLVGLGVYTKQEQRRLDAGPEPEANVHRQTDCRIERSMIDKLEKADAALRQHIRQHNWDFDWPAYQRHADTAKRLAGSSDLAGAFAEQCRAVALLFRTFHKHRHKEELFNPKWDVEPRR